MLEIIIAIMALALAIGVMCFYVGVVICMYDITLPGETRSLTQQVYKRIYFKVSYSRSMEGRGSLFIGFGKRNKN